jgi:mRNA interferase RelE/StbE
MPDYSATFARSARKELERLPSSVGSRIFGRIEALTKAPRPHGVIKLHGSKNLWRMRVDDYRVIYSIDDDARTVDISVIRHRRDAYHQL